MASNVMKDVNSFSNLQDENIVLVLHFSTDANLLTQFKQELLDQISLSCLSNEDNFLVKFDNKYYTADIKFLLYSLADSNENIQENTPILSPVLKIIPKAQALVIVIDENKSGWDLLRKLWDENISQEFTEDVQLVCVYAKNNTISESADSNLQWTVKEHFEFIPMNAQTQIENDENYFKEKFGISRVLEALQTHVWTNIQMKESSPQKTVINTPNPTQNDCEDKFNTDSEYRIQSLLDEMSIASELNGNDSQTESFEKLFGQLVEMRHKAASLEGEERKEYAEKIVTLFMNAIPDSDDD